MKKYIKSKLELEKIKQKSFDEMDRNIKNQEKMLNDKRNIHDVINDLNLEGTLNLVNQIEIAVKNLHNLIEQKVQFSADKLTESISKSISDENSLKNSSISNIEDSKILEKTSKEVVDKETSMELSLASQKAREDQEWLEGIRKEREEKRKLIIERNKNIFKEIKSLRLSNVYKGFKFDPNAKPKPGERIEKDQRDRRLKKYWASNREWPKIVKVQENGQPHSEQEKVFKDVSKKIEKYFKKNN